MKWIFVLLTLISFSVSAQVNITEADYWFDSNTSNIVVVPISPTTQYNFNNDIATNSLNSGLHTFSLRFLQSNGKYSETYSRLFFKVPSNSGPTGNNAVTAYRYWLDSNYSQITNVVLAQPTMNLNLNDSILTTSFSQTPHRISIQFEDELGNWSAPYVDTFSNCINGLPKASFDFVTSGLYVTVVNNSINNSSFRWSFENGDTSILNSVTHYNPTTSNYNVCLEVNNACAIQGDTSCKTISVKGLSAIQTDHGGNNGAVSVNIFGASFVPGMQFYLRKTGEQNIYGDTLIILSSTLIKTDLDLTGKTIGTWDVVAIYPNNDTEVLNNAFTIENPTPPKLWVNITGDNALRIGFNQIYTITYGNDGNSDAIMVPVIIGGLPDSTNIEILQQVYSTDSLFHLDTLQSLPNPISTSIPNDDDNTTFRVVYIPRISGGSSGTMNVIFHLAPNTPVHTYPNISVSLDSGLYTSDQGLKNNNDSNNNNVSANECITSRIEAAAKEVLNIAADAAHSPWADCANELTQFYYDEHKFSKNIPGQDLVDESSLVRGYVGSVVDCGDAIVQTAFPEAKVAITAFKFMKGLYNSKANKFLGALLDARACLLYLKQVATNYFTPIIGNAWDPNTKYGPGTGSANHYTNKDQHLSYVINFENAPTANVPVQTATVTDTLNPKYFNLSTFKFTSVVIGDSIYVLESPATKFVHDFNFVNSMHVKARVVGIFDSTTGIAKWSVFSIDSITNQVTTNALLGFLPPDTAAPNGQGYVSYIVDKNIALQSGDTIRNKASIVFDANPPINTNTWASIFDFIKPQSAVKTLNTYQTDTSFSVSWKGTDNLSGIRYYDIYVSVNDSVPVLWESAISDTTALFTGMNGNKYSFYSIATDSAGNVEDAKTNYDAVTYIANVGIPVYNKQASVLSIFPNPATDGLFNIQGNNQLKGLVTISVLNVSGQLISKDVFDNNTGSFKRLVDLSKQPKGFYTLSIKSDFILNYYKLINL